jgi:hypothetical protein
VAFVVKHTLRGEDRKSTMRGDQVRGLTTLRDGVTATRKGGGRSAHGGSGMGKEVEHVMAVVPWVEGSTCGSRWAGEEEKGSTCSGCVELGKKVKRATVVVTGAEGLPRGSRWAGEEEKGSPHGGCVEKQARM